MDFAKNVFFKSYGVHVFAYYYDPRHSLWTVSHPPNSEMNPLGARVQKLDS